MAAIELPSPDVLRKLLDYNPETGCLHWMARSAEWFLDGHRSAQGKANNWNSRYAGERALNAVVGRGYLGGRLFDTPVKAHRAAWAIYYGEWPEGQIDHINHDRADNRISNLRCVSSQDNSRNMGLMGSNTSGVNGVSWCRKKSRWRAYIKISNKNKHIGYFVTLEAAHQARLDANKQYGFHANHGT